MKLLLLTNEFPNSDQPTRGMFNYQMVRALQRQGDSVEVVSPISWVDRWQAWRDRRRRNSQRPVLMDDPHVHYAPYYYTPRILRGCYGWFMWHSVRRTVLPLLRAATPDAVIGYWAHPDGEVALRIARRIGKPCVVVVGGSDVLLLRKHRARRRRVAQVLQGADAVVVVSEDLKSKVQELGIAPDKVHVGWRGIDTEKFSPGDRAEARRRLGLPPDRRLLLWVGRMDPVKGLNVLIDACRLLKAGNVDFQLLLVGGGPLEHSLRSQCAALELMEHVRFVGPVLHADLPDWYRAADLFVLPSWSEGLPNVLMESMASGIPFVASRVGGIPEIASPTCDQLVPAGDHVALARAIEEQLAARPCRNDTQLERLSWASAACQFIETVDRLSQSTDRSPPSTDDNYSRLSATSSRWSWRQVVRRIMSLTVPRRMITTNGSAKRPLVWLTFDDGPHPDFTPLVLDALLSHGVRATFFVIGEQAEQYPELVRRMVREGHAIGHHTYFHRGFDATTNRQLLEGVRRTSDVLFDLVGRRPTFFRPPHGRMRISAMCRLWAAGQVIVLWNSDPKDYSLASPEELVQWFRKHPLQGGDIALLHDNRPCAAAALPEIIEDVRQRRLEFATIDDPALFG